MHHPAYSINSSSDALLYIFESDGLKGKINKVVAYFKIETGIYNLGFGDLIDGEINDIEITNNGDGAKVISTVINTIPMFFKRYPDCAISIHGSNLRRTEIYKWLIDRYYDELIAKYEIFGFEGMIKKPFEKGKKYGKFEIRLIS